MIPEPNPTWNLYRAIRQVLESDDFEPTRNTFRFYLSQRPSIQFLFRLLEHLHRTPLPRAAAVLYGIKCYMEAYRTGGSGGGITIHRWNNEKNAIDELKRIAPSFPWADLRFDWRRGWTRAPLSLPWRPREVRDLARAIRAIDRLGSRHDLFSLLRVAECIFCYLRYSRVFSTNHFRFAVMSTNSNPHGIAFNLVAHRHGVPVVLVTHGIPATMARLDYELAVLGSEVERRVYEDRRCRIGLTVIRGSRTRYAQMQPIPSRYSVGVFLAKDPAEATTRSTIEALSLLENVERILVRPHPANLWRRLEAFIRGVRSDKVRLSNNDSVQDDIAVCNVVFAGNSTVHVDALLMGRPTCYQNALDGLPYDMYGFVDAGLVFELQDVSSFDPGTVNRFYQRADWLDILRHYANLDEDEAEAEGSVRRWIAGTGAVQSIAQEGRDR